MLATLGWTGVDPRMTSSTRSRTRSRRSPPRASRPSRARSSRSRPRRSGWSWSSCSLAGTNFALLFAGIVGRRPGLIVRDEEVRVGLLLLVAASALVVVVGLLSADILTGEEAVRHGVFNTVSMMTTTGFASADFAQWSALTLARAVRRAVPRRLGGLDRRLDQADPPHRDRQDAAARDRPDAASRGRRAAAGQRRRRRRARAARDHRLRLPLPRRLRRRRRRRAARLDAAGRRR